MRGGLVRGTRHCDSKRDGHTGNRLERCRISSPQFFRRRSSRRAHSLGGLGGSVLHRSSLRDGSSKRRCCRTTPIMTLPIMCRRMPLLVSRTLSHVTQGDTRPSTRRRPRNPSFTRFSRVERAWVDCVCLCPCKRVMVPMVRLMFDIRIRDARNPGRTSFGEQWTCSAVESATAVRFVSGHGERVRTWTRRGSRSRRPRTSVEPESDERLVMRLGEPSSLPPPIQQKLARLSRNFDPYEANNCIPVDGWKAV